MAQYIDKQVIAEKIEERKKQNVLTNEGAFEEDVDILCLLDTLDTKEVGLEKGIELYWKQCDLTWCKDAYTMTHIRAMLSDIAKHFFELGLKAKGE